MCIGGSSKIARTAEGVVRAKSPVWFRLRRLRYILKRNHLHGFPPRLTGVQGSRNPQGAPLAGHSRCGLRNCWRDRRSMIAARTADECDLGPQDWKRSVSSDGKRQPAQARPVRRQLLVRPRGRDGAGALVRERHPELPNATQVGNLPGGLSASPFHPRPASSPTLLLGRQGGEYRSEAG
jgi:hypothetical protein